MTATMRGRSGHRIIDQQDIGALSLGKRAAIGKARGTRRRRRHQVPGPGERQHVIGGEPERREQRRRIVIVRGQHRAEALCDHVGGLGPAGMAAAAHDIGRAEHDGVAARRRLARGLLVDGKFGDRRRPCARNALRSAGVLSSCESIRTFASRAIAARRAIDPGTSSARDSTFSTSRSNASSDKPGALDHGGALARLVAQRRRESM